MHIATSKTREQFPLSVKKIYKKTFAQTALVSIVLLILYIVITVILVTAEDFSGIGFGIATVGILGFLLLLILGVYFFQRWYYAVYFYDFTNDYIVIRKGPITPSEITIPYERIQDVYVDQDLLDRIFGLYDVHLSSATISSGMSAHIDGVEKQAAEGLRQVLLQTVQQRISRHRAGNDVVSGNIPRPPSSPTN